MKYDILIAQEKHGNKYFDISTHEKFDLVCRKLLKELLDEGLLFIPKVLQLENLNKCLNSPVETELLANRRYPLSYDFLYYYSDHKYLDIEITCFEQI